MDLKTLFDDGKYGYESKCSNSPHVCFGRDSGECAELLSYLKQDLSKVSFPGTRCDIDREDGAHEYNQPKS